jgi:phospholipid-binding lipoprotein MlaA
MVKSAKGGQIVKGFRLSVTAMSFVFAAIGFWVIDGFSMATAAQALEEVVITDTKLDRSDDGVTDYDPWEGFNDTMFTFNHDILDRYILKPVAKGYDVVIGDGEKQIIHNVVDNVGMPKRLINSLLQGKFMGAGRELARFLINSTLGGAGMTDVAKYQFGIEQSNEDTGQTFGVWGWDRSRYLVLPFLSPLTLRDGVGYVFDLAMDPINYFLPFVGSVGRRVGETVNERAINLDNFESVEEGTVDLYSAVRNAYLNKREKLIKE